MVVKKKNRVIISVLLAIALFVGMLLPFIGGLTYCSGKYLLEDGCYSWNGVDPYWSHGANFLSKFIINFTQDFSGFAMENSFFWGFIFAIIAGLIIYLLLTLVAKHRFKV